MLFKSYQDMIVMILGYCPQKCGHSKADIRSANTKGRNPITFLFSRAASLILSLNARHSAVGHPAMQQLYSPESWAQQGCNNIYSLEFWLGVVCHSSCFHVSRWVCRHSFAGTFGFLLCVELMYFCIAIPMIYITFLIHIIMWIYNFLCLFCSILSI